MNYIDMCKAIKAKDPTNKIVAAVHEMGHYILASTIKSPIITITPNHILLLPSESGRWYGCTNIGYNPIEPLTKDSPQFLLEVYKKKIPIGYAGKYAELAMFGINDPSGFKDDLTRITEAQLYITKNDPDFDIENYTERSATRLVEFMQEKLDVIAKNALTLFHTLNSTILYPKDISTTP